MDAGLWDLNARLASDCAMGEQGGVRKLAGDHGSSGKRMEWKVGKGAVATRWRHEGVGVLAHIQASLLTELLGRIEVRTC